ncbi:Fc.00g078100.m01.CDS01 [Cosmosporella sp. VM-42]
MSNYGYGPPPPPPSASSSGHPSYGPSPPSYGQPRGGSHHGRARGGPYGGRGDYHASAPTPPAPYEYTGQPYPSHNPQPYGASHPPAGSYPPPPPQQQWAPEHAHAPPHGPGPVPMSANNYHPNYAPQPYPPSQYPQQPQYPAPQQYGPPYPGPPPPNQPQWNGQVPSHSPPYANGRPPRAYNDRGGPKAPMGGPGRPPYEHEAMPPPVNGGYGQPYPPDPRVAHYPPPQYPSYPGPPPPPGPPQQDAYYGQSGRRGRGGGFRDGHSRGRGSFRGGEKDRHQRPAHNDHTHSPHKPEPTLVGKKKKRKMNTLGLTPAMDSDSEDDEGEEKVLSDLIGQETIDIKDVASFLAERKRHFPTKARVEAKKAEMAQNGEGKVPSDLQRKADKLRRQLEKVESSIKRKRDQGDEGDEMRDTSEELSDDEKPEVMSTRSHVALPPPPPAKKADVSKHCKYYSTGGTCGKKGKCRFVHDPEVREAALKEREANNGRMTIQQRLILNDKEQEDLTVIQSIQYLREKGLMPPADKPETKKETNGENNGVVVYQQQPASSLLPAAPASLPPLPVKKQTGLPRHYPPPSTIPSANGTGTQEVQPYKGWNLEPYGRRKGRHSSDDLP